MSETKLNVSYGNECSFELRVNPETHTLFDLYYAVAVLLDLKVTNILCLVSDGRVLGQNESLKIQLEKLGLFGTSKGTVNVILYNNDLESEYSNADLVVNSKLVSLSKDVIRSHLIEQVNHEDVSVTLSTDDYLQVTTVINEDESNQDGTCSVCHESFQDSLHLAQVKINGCGHTFHNSCLIGWLCRTSVHCPVCNVDVRDFISQ